MYRVGQKVVPFKKSAYSKYTKEDFYKYLRCSKDVPEFFNQNGYVFISEIDGDIYLLSNSPHPSGDYFLKGDFRPFIENIE